MSEETDSGALELIRREGIWGLGTNEGCPCCEFSVRNVSVSISCRKSSGSDLPERPDFIGSVLRVWSRHMDVSKDYLAEIATEIKGQLDPWRQEVVILFDPPTP